MKKNFARPKTSLISKKTLLVFGLAMSSLWISSCNSLDETVNNGIGQELSTPTDNTVRKLSSDDISLRTSQPQKEVDALTAKFAKALAKSLSQKEFRDFLKLEAQKKFDGDFDILVSRSFTSLIKSKSLKQTVLDGGDISQSEIETLSKLNLKLNISIPINIDKWSTDTEAPLVAYKTSDYVENKTQSLIAFDFKGEQYAIDAIKEPTVPVIVIGSNERMGYTKPQAGTASLRTSGNYERVEYLKCPNLSDIEGWANGAPEIRFDGVIYSIAGGTAMSACSNMEYVPSRSHAKDGYTLAYWTQTQNLFRWYFDAGHGPNYFLQTFEVDDSGSTQTVNVGVTYQGMTSSVQLAYKEDDKKLKGELIHSTHPSPATIGDGNIEFRLEN